MKQKFQNWYKTYMDKWLPAYALFSLIGCFVWNCLIYWMTQRLGADLYHYDFTTELDRAVPFLPSFVSIYVLSYPFWVLCYILIAKENSKENWYRFVFADMLARLICGICFLAIPTTNIRPEITGSSFFEIAMGFIYEMDLPYNLFPSIHCLASMMCYLGLRTCSRIPKPWKWATLGFAVLVFASTQFTKQHYLVDVIGGVLIALGCYMLSMRSHAYQILERLFDNIYHKVFEEDSYGS